MQTIRWYRRLALGVMVVPIVAEAQGPQPVVKQVATLVGIGVEDAVRMPNGHVLIYGAGDSISAYDLTTKRTRVIARGWDYELAIAPQGNRIAYARLSESGDDDLVWSLPIDPNSGAATGPAQRISMSPGDSPSFSPDGKLVAFGIDRGKKSDLAVVSATGGPERVLAKYEHGLDETYWSADGMSVFAEVLGGTDSAWSIERVPAAGGRSEHLLAIPKPQSTEGSLAGNIAFYRPDKTYMSLGRVLYLTRTGAHGGFAIPPGSAIATSLGVPQPLVVNVTRPTGTHILDLTTGRISTPFAADVDGNQFRWSPDGRHVALQAGDEAHRVIVVANGDGTAPRRYPVANLSSGMQWAPDAKTIAFHADSGRSVGLLDVASGRSRVLLSVARPKHAGGMHWRADGKAIFLNQNLATDPKAPPHPAIAELLLDGTSRIVKDVHADVPQATSAGMIDDHSLVATSGNANGVKITVVDLAGGNRRTFQVPAPDAGVRRLRVGPSGFGEGVGPNRQRVWYAVEGSAENHESDRLRIFSLNGQPERKVGLPFQFLPADVKLLPDGNHAVVYGRLTDNPAPRFFLVPLDGSAPRTFDPNPGERDRSNSNTYLSPDGRYLGFTTQGTPTSRIYDIDLTPVLRAAGIH